MAENDKSVLLNRGKEIGLTNEQYKDILLNQLEIWEDILEMVEVAGVIGIQDKVKEQIAEVKEKLQLLISNQLGTGSMEA